ncbi:MAG: hypothetical protein JNJ70_06875 [Verrucomicrobiales bacterium]|nr:hypothetical protein [Verrucomicrobiales bacterium]
MMESALVALPVILPLGLALVAWMGRRSPVVSRSILIAGTALILAAAVALFLAVRAAGGPLRLDLGGWERPVGITFKVDLLSALLVVVSATVAFAGALFAAGEIGRLLWAKGYGTFSFLLFTGIHGAFLTNDLFNLFVWFEVMLMSSFAMLVLGRRRHVFEGATQYVVINMVSSFFFLTGLGILYGKTGHLNLEEVAARLVASGSDPVILSSATLLLIAFGIKAGVFPLYFWLPPAYPNTGYATAAVFGGLLTKVGVYALFRVFGGAFGFLSGYTSGIFLLVGVATMIAGVLGAASQFHVRRILSFHIVSQIGYILLGLGLMTQGAIAAALFYTVHHIFVKTNLFLAAGAIASTGRTEDLAKLGGLLKATPLLAILFLIPALSLGGIPPLSGFFAKFLLIREAMREEAWIVTAIALLVGVVTLFSMTKIWSEAFWKDSPRKGGPLSLCRRSLLLLPVAFLGLLTLLIGLFPGSLISLADEAARQLLATNPATLSTSP